MWVTSENCTTPKRWQRISPVRLKTAAIGFDFFTAIPQKSDSKINPKINPPLGPARTPTPDLNDENTGTPTAPRAI